MRKARIFINNIFAGILTEDEDGYHFSYLSEYLQMDGAVALAPKIIISVRE